MSQKLSERLEAHIEAWPTTYGTDRMNIAILNECLAIVRAVEGDAWIPVVERLPEDAGRRAVLAFDANRRGKGVWLETMHPSWWGQFMEHTNEWGPDITHWRPLPPPPLDAADDGRGG